MAIVLHERTSGREPSAQFSLDRSATTVTYVLWDDEEPEEDGKLVPISNEELYAQILALIGGTSTEVGDGSIDRTLPRAHPRFPSLFAEDITLRPPPGEDYREGDEASEGLEAPTLDGYAAYVGYELDVLFTQRPFAVVKNESMRPRLGDYWDEDGNAVAYVYAPEWLRYTTYETEDASQLVDASLAGGMRFRAPDVAGVNNKQYSATPTLRVPDQKITMRWYQVPQRYLDSDNSFLNRYVGYINQEVFYGWAEGSLLFLGAKKTKTYSPPAFEALADEIFPGIFTTEKLCDIELTFLRTQRTAGADVPENLRPNRNWLAKGHNLLPDFLTRKYYYATTAPTGADANDATKWYPSYQSVPFQLLYQDPDAEIFVE